MSDEIDIEEHDVMDNPSIRRIFPDLSVIKKEINQYYDEALPALPKSILVESSQGTSINSDMKNQHNTDKFNRNEKKSTTHISVPTVIESPKESRHLHENIIILGSKPNAEYRRKKCSSMEKQEPKLILKNVSSFLNSCKRYCKECRILFPKPNILNLHMYNIHIQKKENLNSNPRELKTLYKCNTCNTSFSSKFSLIRHLKNAHGNFGIINNSNKKMVLSENSRNELAKRQACFHCQQLFPTQSSLIEHLYDVMKPKNMETVNSTSSSTIANEANEKERLINRSNENECGENCKVNRDPKQESYTSDNLRPKTNKCNKCTEQFGSKGELEYHFMTIHKNLTKSNNTLNEKINVESKMKKKCIGNLNKKQCKGKLMGMLYQCFICSKYNLTFKFYSRHMLNDHNLKEVTKVEKVLFDSQCNFCTSKLSNMKYYNVHINKYHKKLLKKSILPHEQQEGKRNSERLNKEFHFALHSILYQCMNCDTFFLSANVARSHVGHIKILDDWKCSVCQRIFKKKDKALHLKQHLFSQTFTVHALSGSEFSRVLYKCPKCAVHYSEEQYSLHYSKCGTETPDSLYCKACDILINRNDMDFHELNHRDKKMQCSDFTIIESEIIEPRIIQNRVKNKRDILNVDNRNGISESLLKKSKLAMAFCHTCKCFINNVHLTRNVHIEERCGHMLKTVCKECGLLLTMKTHTTHKKIHMKKKINLQHYYFYDLISQKRICPPIPDFPGCKGCGVHFLRKNAILIHSCHQQDFETCNICMIKFTEHAYKLHMAYHNYSIRKENKNPKDSELEIRPTSDILSNKDQNSCGLDNSNFADLPFLYTCKGCQITLNTYDRTVEHCQDHYDCKDIQLNTQKCQYCILTFDGRDYEIHTKLHLNGNYNKDSITVVEFDPFYFRYNNDFWTKHIFAYVAEEQIRKILDTSIYKYECRLKLEELQSGTSSMTFYKCEKCQVYIEPRSLYLHVKNSTGSSCVKLRKHPCSFCGLCFLSAIHRMAHEKEHKGIDINLKSYKIILFNKKVHDTFNNIMFEACNQYIIYQCRNCERVVDKLQRKSHQCDVNYLKICPTCGLLIHKQDYDLHFIRHEELDKFNTENMVVIMFGKLLYFGKKEFRSTFSGTKYDYTIYKCNNCELCLRSKLCTSKHVCVSENSKFKCTKCGLYFSKLELKYHSRQHDSSLEFDKYNMNIITFSASSQNHVDPKEPLDENNETQKQIDQAGDKNVLVKENINNCSEKLERIYKCDCGLHFLEELNAQKHTNNCNARIKISKQSCFKCDLLFTPGELFNHLLKHHCDKKIQYKFDIVNVYKKDKKIDNP